MIRTAALALLLLAPVSASAQEAPLPPPQNQSAGSFVVPIPEVQKKVKKKKVAETFQGEWEMILPPELERMFTVMNMAIDGADDAAFAAMSLTPQEQQVVDGVRGGMAAVPAEQQAEMREMLKAQFSGAFDSFFLRVTADKLELGMQGESMEATWSEVEAENNRLIVKIDEPDNDQTQMTIYFADENHIVMASDKEDQRLGWVRKGFGE